LDVTASSYNLNVAVDWSNSGTFTANSGTVTFNGTTQAVSGTTTFNNITINSGATVTNNGTVTAASLGSEAGAWTQGANSTLNYSGASITPTLTATADNNTVNYSGAAQTVKVVTYHDLTLSGSGIKTFSVTTVEGTLTLSGSATCAPGASLAITGDLVINSSGAAPTSTWVPIPSAWEAPPP